MPDDFSVKEITLLVHAEPALAPRNPSNEWKGQERRWDIYHWFRTCGLIVAFVLLVASALR
jgi:hypothetical protein